MILIKELQTQLESSPNNQTITIEIVKLQGQITQVQSHIQLQHNILVYLKLILHIELQITSIVPSEGEAEEVEISLGEEAEEETPTSTVIYTQYQIAILTQMKMQIYIRLVMVLYQVSTPTTESEIGLIGEEEEEAEEATTGNVVY